MSRLCKIYECLFILPLIIELLIRLGIYQGIDYSNMPSYITEYEILLFLSYTAGWSFLNASLAIFLLDIIYIYLSVCDVKIKEIVFPTYIEFFVSKRAKDSIKASFQSTLYTYFYNSIPFYIQLIALLYITRTDAIADGFLQLHLLFAI